MQRIFSLFSYLLLFKIAHHCILLGDLAKIESTILPLSAEEKEGQGPGMTPFYRKWEDEGLNFFAIWRWCLFVGAVLNLLPLLDS